MTYDYVSLSKLLEGNAVGAGEEPYVEPSNITSDDFILKFKKYIEGGKSSSSSSSSDDNGVMNISSSESDDSISNGVINMNSNESESDNAYNDVSSSSQDEDADADNIAIGGLDKPEYLFDNELKDINNLINEYHIRGNDD